MDCRRHACDSKHSRNLARLTILDDSLHDDRSLLRKDFFDRYKKGHSFE
ncbi:hypothetical protein SAMN04488483_2736 [Pseudomonas helmanticensis]|uniref:Uncharacterized protein n=1 Tax=Pseudomonas helmanticensis TaxID=1471381 RepID=A0ACD2U645_9PSED|nr:hypothetical protein SAMN04488483_2736 [Pseudomonas helmanticensis]